MSSHATLTGLRLKNFKSWQSLDIEMTPLTLLFGTNSSGKSSVLQAILLLLQSAEYSEDKINFGGNISDYVYMGSYRDIVFAHDLEREVNIEFHWKGREYGVNMIYENDEISVLQLNRGLKHLWRLTGFINYLGPLRQHPQRSYLWSGASPRKIESDGENAIAALIESTRRDGKLVRQVGEWLVKMDLVKSFRVNPLDEGKRFYEPLVDIAGVETALLDVGFGVSQVLPVITTLFFVPEGSIVLLEQPELHLHPRAQAHLADLMLHVAEKRKLQLIVESHSEHLLRRLQRRIAEEEQEFASPENVRMYFCDSGDNGSIIQPVEVDIYGQIRNWPDKFFGDITGDLEAMTMAALKRSINGKN